MFLYASVQNSTHVLNLLEERTLIMTHTCLFAEEDEDKEVDVDVAVDPIEPGIATSIIVLSEDPPPGIDAPEPEDLLPDTIPTGGPESKSAHVYGTDGVDRAALQYCERFVELLIDMMSQLPTRRFVRALLEDRAVLVKCRLCPLYRHESGVLFAQLLDLFKFYMNFNIDDHTGMRPGSL